MSDCMVSQRDSLPGRRLTYLSEILMSFALLLCRRLSKMNSRTSEEEELLRLIVERCALLDRSEATYVQGPARLLAGQGPTGLLAMGTLCLPHNPAATVLGQAPLPTPINCAQPAAAEHHRFGHPATCQKLWQAPALDGLALPVDHCVWPHNAALTGFDTDDLELNRAGAAPAEEVISLVRGPILMLVVGLQELLKEIAFTLLAVASDRVLHR